MNNVFLRSKRLRRVLPLVLLLLGFTNQVSADCIGPPNLFVGESATYRYTDADANNTDVTIKVLSEEKYWYVLLVTENERQYRATVGTGCFDTGFPSDYEPPKDPSFYDFPKLIELLQPDSYPFSSNQWEFNQQFEMPTCERDSVAYGAPLYRTLQIARCSANSQNGLPVDDVISAETELLVGTAKPPLGGLIAKTLYLTNNRTRSIRLIRLGDLIPQNGQPQPAVALNAISYSATALELIWQRPQDMRAVAFEVHRDDETLGVFDALSYYDDSQIYLSRPRYSVTAIDAQGNRSITTSIVPGVYNYGFTGDYQASAPVIPTAQNFFARIYSSTAAELFWLPSHSEFGFSYEVARNGVVMQTTDGTSYFDDTLELGGRYSYELTTVANNGARSTTLRTEITTPNPLNTPTTPDATYTFTAQHEVYSTTAAEMFWDYPIGGGIGRRYEIYQNGNLVAATNGNSFFTDNLQPGTEYQYEIYYYGFNGELEAVSESVLLTTPNLP